MQPGTDQPAASTTGDSNAQSTPAGERPQAAATPATDQGPVGEGTERKRKRRRRRRGRKGRGEGPHKKGQGSRQAPEPEVTLQPSLLDQSLPPDHPLSEAEVAEMQRHLKFINVHRNALRLRLNAAEDLLVNGARPPEHRGRCMHLLSKIDLACVEKSLERVPDARARTRLLAGVVRFSTDLGVLLLYLESLVDAASRRDAAAAFSLAVTRMDFASVSTARMERILQLISDSFTEEHELAQVVFGLLHSRSFRNALDAADERLSYALRGHFTALLAVHEVIIEGKPSRFPRALLAHGVLSLLSAPEDSLRALPEPIRVRLLEVALGGGVEAEVGDRAAGAMLDSLPKAGDDYARLALARSRSLIERGLDKRAKWQLKQIRAAHPKSREVRGLLDILDAPRLGPFALVWPERKGRESKPSRAKEGWVRAFAIHEQSRVWLRVGNANDVSAFESASAIHGKLILGGLAPLVAAGTGKGKVPYSAVAATGQPISGRGSLGEASLQRLAAITLQALQVLGGLASAGHALPDLAPQRFLLVKGPRPTLLLADLTGVQTLGIDAAHEAHEKLVVPWVQDLLRDVEAELPEALRTVLAHESPSLVELAKLLSLEA